ncbi:MAG: Hsp20/alpha crystallin family protein [Cyanobacteria bacterium P01_H01_bin.119]
MIVRYWEPLQEMNTLRRQIDRVFDDLSQPVRAVTAFTPALKLVDQGDEFVLTVYLPGIDAAGVDVQATREAVTLSGDRVQTETAEGETVLINEVRYGSFKRTVTLPVAIQNDKVSAAVDNGVLTLTLPKVEAARNTVVKINLAQPQLAEQTDAIADGQSA